MTRSSRAPGARTPGARRIRRILPIVLVSGAAACGAGRAASVGPVADPSGTARRMTEVTALQAPTRIDFSWSLNEAGSRVSGVGVARVEPPYRARLDLFLDNGESVISAALVDDELRLPPGAPDDVLPPADLMWATLGIFRPVKGASLIGGDRLDNGAQRLRYRFAGGELDFEVDGSRLLRVDLLDDGSVLQWVRVEGGEGEGLPGQVTYRNLVDFRELVIRRTSASATDPFDPMIWDPR